MRNQIGLITIIILIIIRYTSPGIAFGGGWNMAEQREENAKFKIMKFTDV